MSSNLAGFFHNFSPVDQCSHPLLRKQRRRFRFSPVKLRTVKVNIFFLECSIVRFILLCVFSYSCLVL